MDSFSEEEFDFDDVDLTDFLIHQDVYENDIDEHIVNQLEDND